MLPTAFHPPEVSVRREKWKKTKRYINNNIKKRERGDFLLFLRNFEIIAVVLLKTSGDRKRTIRSHAPNKNSHQIEKKNVTSKKRV